MKAHKSVIINVAACTLSLILLILLAFDHDKSRDQNDQANEGVVDTVSSIRIESSIYTDEVPLVNQAILTFMAEDNTKSAHSVYGMYNGYGVELNKGLPVKFSYRVAGIPDGITVSAAVLEISEHSEFQGARSFTLSTNGDQIEIYNLLTGTDYYYRLKLQLSVGNWVETRGEFFTLQSPRIMNLDGAVNVRDIGGWMTESGVRIPQGLLYRGSELDGAVEPEYLLTEAGLQEMVTRLGIRYDLDLRSETVNPSKINALGANVKHEYFNAPMYADAFLEGNRETMRSIFSSLANPDHYPIYLHCTYGRDRTGTVCYILEALLGVSAADLRRDYEMSAFTDSYADLENFARLTYALEQCEGDTLSQKAESYLKGIGVTAEEIDSIRNIFLGNAQ